MQPDQVCRRDPRVSPLADWPVNVVQTGTVLHRARSCLGDARPWKGARAASRKRRKAFFADRSLVVDVGEARIQELARLVGGGGRVQDDGGEAHPMALGGRDVAAPRSIGFAGLEP